LIIAAKYPISWNSMQCWKNANSIW